MKYRGGKNGSGVYQRLISLMPPHRTYIEAFLGSGAVLRRKRPAEKSFAFELNQATIAELIKHLPGDFVPAADWNPGEPLPHNGGSSILFRSPANPDGSNLEIFNRDAFGGLKTYSASSLFWGWNDPAETLIYCDPPYPRSVRSAGASIYQFEMLEEKEHSDLCDLLLTIPAKIMLSGYDNDLYNSKLKGWRKFEIPTTTRGGKPAIETVWLNFPEPFELHDYRFLGTDFHDRDRIKRKAGRWIANLEGMPATERYAIFGQLKDLRDNARAAELVTEAAWTKKLVARAHKKEKSAVSPDPTLPAAGELPL